jgi:hypothetical protein
MPKFKIEMKSTDYWTLEIEADDVESARDEAYRRVNEGEGIGEPECPYGFEIWNAEEIEE